MSYLVKALLQANIDSLDRAIASGRLVGVLKQYGDLIEFILLYEVNDDPAYDALARAFDWLRNRIGFNVAPPVRVGQIYLTQNIMDTIKKVAPSVWAYIYDEGRPTGCSRCPYAVEHDLDNLYRDRPNPSDPDEGWYDCKLLNKGKYWGENPGCTEEDWRVSAQNQLIEMLNPVIRHDCDKEAAKALLGRFWAAIWDDRNLQKTGREIRSEIMDGVSPRVRYEFERLLSEGATPNGVSEQTENPVSDGQN